jgi:hypothetical protein
MLKKLRWFAAPLIAAIFAVSLSSFVTDDEEIDPDTGGGCPICLLGYTCKDACKVTQNGQAVIYCPATLKNMKCCTTQ